MAFSEEERSSSTRVAELIDRAWEGERENTRLASSEEKDDVPNPEEMSTAQDAVYKVPYLKCFYTNAHSMKNKQDELRALAQSLRFDVTDISETCGFSLMSPMTRFPCWMVTGTLGEIDRAEELEGRHCMVEGLEYRELTVGNGAVESL